ncbi:DUF6880 family protein [Mesorhizobium sp. A623]
MASKTALNAKNLEGLGVQRLAELLIEISIGDAAAKRLLRLELVSAESPREVAREVRKRLSAISRSRTFVDWQKRKALIEDLKTQRRAIVEKVAPGDPSEALDLMWRFVGLADSIFERCNDGTGAVMSVFEDGVSDLALIAQSAAPNPEALAAQIFTAIQNNGYGQYDDLIETLSTALGPTGLDHLKAQLQALAKRSSKVPVGAKRQQVMAWSMRGPIYADEIEENSNQITIRMALQNIADAQKDVDGFIALHDGHARKMPKIATEIAKRLLADGRPQEAWTAITTVEESRSGWLPYEWEEMYLTILEALGRTDDAQAFRWTCFERALSVSHLRNFLSRLPDFEDLEAEERALRHVAAHSSLLSALSFMIDWKDFNRASKLIIQRIEELDGNHYEILAPAAEALSGTQPLAATLLLRAMIDFSLETGRSSRYPHAARHLIECGSLAGSITDFGGLETHDVYSSRLRVEHGRKASFWSHIT